MAQNELSTVRGDGQLALNILNFARTLRAAGLPVGPGKVLDAVRAARTVGISRRADFYWCLHAALVNRPEQRALFDQAFHVYFRNPRLIERLMSLVMPGLRVPRAREPESILRRLVEALADGDTREEGPLQSAIELDAAGTASHREVLSRKDFAEMSALELSEAKQILRECDFGFGELRTRRYRAGRRGNRVAMRETLRRTLKHGGQLIPLVRSEPLRRPPPLVLICDISGSMGRYSRLFLHFAHSVTSARDRVSTFVFATRLTNITHYLRHRDVDHALERISTVVPDWSGGTRIGACMRQFNRAWSRRVLAQGAIVLFLSDGLERERGPTLSQDMERLQKSCRRLIWLNPLLRYQDFQPRARGVRKILPHVDEFRPAHNVNSLRDLARALTG